MSIALVTPPSIEPLTVHEVRRHLKLDAMNVEPTPDAVTVALASPAAPGNVDNGAHRYRVTFVTADGETDGGTISASVTVANKAVNGQVFVSSIPLGGAAVTARRIYRTIAGGSNYFLLATIADNSTITYTDNIADASLGAGVPTSNTTDDPYLFSILKAARQHLENRFGRAFLTQTWRLTLDSFPIGWGGLAVSAAGIDGARAINRLLCIDEISLPAPVLQSVTSVTYVDSNGAPQTLSPTLYSVDTDAFPGRIVLAYGQVWPVTRIQRNAVTVTFVAGYTAATLVPSTWAAALKLLIAHWYDHPELLGSASDVAIPESVDSLMWPDRYLEVA